MFLINFYLFIFFLQYVPKYESENVITECDTNVDAFQPQNDEEIKLVTMLDEAEEVDLKEIVDILGIMYQNDCSAEKLKTFPTGTVDDIMSLIYVFYIFIYQSDPKIKNKEEKFH